MAMTPYGPGKFDWAASEVPYRAMLEGLADEDAQTETEWASLFRGAFDAEQIRQLGMDPSQYNEDDMAALAAPAHILSQDNSGLVYWAWFDSLEDAEQAWSEIKIAESEYWVAAESEEA